MAKLKSNDKVIPFAEGAPPDDLVVEEIDDETVLIGEPEEYKEPSTEFDANLAEVIEQKEINEHATTLLIIMRQIAKLDLLGKKDIKKD